MAWAEVTNIYKYNFSISSPLPPPPPFGYRKERNVKSKTASFFKKSRSKLLMATSRGKGALCFLRDKAWQSVTKRAPLCERLW